MLQTKRKALVVSLFAALMLLAGGTVSTLAQPAGASTAEEAVRALVGPLSNPSAGGGACDTVRGQLRGCPVTQRLLDRLQHPTPAENGNLISRSQNPPLAVAIKQVDNNGSVAHVETAWRYGAGVYGITFVVINQNASWLVDDSYCTGHPETTIYTSPTGPCEFQVITSGDTGTPGMPTTGAEGNVAPTLLGMGALALVAGLGLALFGARRSATGQRRKA